MLGGLFCMCLASCTPNYEFINQNHAGITDKQAEADGYNIITALLTMQNNVISTNTSRAQYTELLLGGAWGRYAAETKANAWPSKFSTFDPPAGWSSVLFQEVIPYIFPQVSEIQAVTEDVVPKSIALILKVAAMHRVTDTYGPIPYSKIGVDGKLEVPYDSQEQVYQAMFRELDQAIKDLTEHQTESITAKGDLVYKGDLSKWIKYANSLKLRLAMRICYVGGFNVDGKTSQQLAEEAVNHSVGVMTSNDDMAKITSFTTAGNPLNEGIKFNDQDHHAIAEMTMYMNGFKDPRLSAYFVKSQYTDQPYCGIRTGLAPIGVDQFKKFSTINISRETPLVWMYASEVMFLRAEGALRNWNMGGDAETFYRKGIQLSFDYWGVSDNSYFEGTTKPEIYNDPSRANSYTEQLTDITVKWDASASFEKNLERIIVQKWIANFPLGVEAWSEMRRTGYPKVLPIVQNNSGGLLGDNELPRRCPYPTDESISNHKNYTDAVVMLGGADNIKTHVWWDCKN